MRIKSVNATCTIENKDGMIVMVIDYDNNWSVTVPLTKEEATRLSKMLEMSFSKGTMADPSVKSAMQEARELSEKYYHIPRTFPRVTK